VKAKTKLRNLYDPLFAPLCGDRLVEQSVDCHCRVTNEELLEFVA
jgi:hypothetical protein